MGELYARHVGPELPAGPGLHDALVDSKCTHALLKSKAFASFISSPTSLIATPLTDILDRIDILWKQWDISRAVAQKECDKYSTRDPN